MDVQTLAQRIKEIEESWQNRGKKPVLPDVEGLGQWLPEAQLTGGTLVEVLAASAGAGAWTLALLMAKGVCGQDRALVVVDRQRCFYPPAAARWGIDLERSLVVRPRTLRDSLLATNQSLRCVAVGGVVGWYDPLRTLDVRRLQLAAEAGGGVGFVLRPAEAMREPSFAPLRLRVSSVASVEAARRLRLDVVRCRGHKGGQSVLLEVSNETGCLHVLPEMASPAAAAPTARAAR